LVGNGAAIAEFRTLDTEFLGLRVDALGGSAQFVDFFVFFAVAIELVTDTRAVGGGEGSETAFFGEILMVDRANIGRLSGEMEWAGIAGALKLDVGPGNFVNQAYTVFADPV